MGLLLNRVKQKQKSYYDVNELHDNHTKTTTMWS